MNNKKSKAIFYILCSAFCFALMNLFVRLSGELPSIQKSFFRNLVAMVFALILLLRSGEGIHFQKKNLPLLIARSTFGTLGILCNFYAVDHLLLSDASMLNKLSPFFAILFSFLLLKEKIKPVQLVGMAAAFLGSLLIVKPGFAMESMGAAWIGVLGGMSAGAAYTFVRWIKQRGEKGALIVFFFSAFSCLVTLPFLLFDYHPMSWYQFAMLMLAGLSASGGQFAITAAYSNAPASEISVYDYTQVIFAALLGFVFFHQIPDVWSILGYVIICGVSLFLFWYQPGKMAKLLHKQN